MTHMPYGRILLLLLCACSPLAAQRRFDVTPLAGYRFHDSFPTKDSTDENRGEAKLGHGESFGVAAGIRYLGEEVIEFRWIRQNTKLTAIGPSPLGTREQGASVDQFHGDFTHEYILQDFPRVRPYVIGSAGVTKVKSGADDFTRFSFGLGAGAKVFATPRIGFRFEAQWAPVYISPEVRNAFCVAGGCAIVIEGKLVHQVQFSVGPVFSF